MTESFISKAHTGRSDFEERRAGRILRLRKRATKKREEGAASLAGARRLASIIPFGQPILVGHHSERRHRRDQKRINAGYDKGFRLENEATALESRARSAEANTTISSDDPDAPERIRAKLTAIEENRASMKEANALIRRAKGDAERAVALLAAAGFAEPAARQLLKPDFAGRVGFAEYQLTNAGAEIRRLQKRLTALTANAAAQASAPEKVIGQVTLREANNRTQVVFPGKPDESARKLLKSYGFRWAPSEGAWQRLSTPAARRAAEDIARRLSAP